MDFLSGIKIRWHLFIDEVKAFFTDKEVCRRMLLETLKELFPAWLLYVSGSLILCLMVAVFLKSLLLTAFFFLFYLILFIVVKIYEASWNRKHEKKKSSYFFVARIFLLAVCMTLAIINLQFF